MNVITLTTQSGVASSTALLIATIGAAAISVASLLSLTVLNDGWGTLALHVLLLGGVVTLVIGGVLVYVSRPATFEVSGTPTAVMRAGTGVLDIAFDGSPTAQVRLATGASTNPDALEGQQITLTGCRASRTYGVSYVCSAVSIGN